ncbi:unnamed protein product [Pleuronectes platessa]|uniref:Uncharacterized protein n=1 Tax=Pleuronectes platessa TaxID=8262 RepID=A0A9N7V269_PLEPL|nr:unnamed protein product [Pleuronectes platessa]
MPKYQKPKPGPDASDSPDVDPTAEISCKEIDSLASDLKTEILNVHAEFTRVTEEMWKENATFYTRIDDLEEEANGQASRVVALEAKVNRLSTQVTRLTDKTEDLESRQRRDNCRLIGVEEGLGNIRPERAVAEC